jgi:glycerol-3-phosphate dehydrogenase
VREALHERGLLHRNAPHLAHPLGFVVPLYSWFGSGFYGIGLRVYDLLAGSLGIGSSKLMGWGETIQRIPTLERDGLLGGVLYYDGQFDDARLAITLLRTFEDHGGVAINYMRAAGLTKSDRGRITGVRARDEESGEEFEIRACGVINATGVYADTVRRMDEPAAKQMLSPSQGVHIVLDRSFLPGENAIMVPKTDDGRVLFVVPWHNHALVGTTDTPVKDAPIEPRALEEEIEFLLTHARRYLNKDPQPSDVRSVYAGLRPLVKGSDNAATAALSRDHTLIVSDGGLVTITGGKWTTYRKMGEDTVNKAAQVASLPRRDSITRELKLHGATETPQPEPLAVYGTDASALQSLIAEQPAWAEPLHPDLPYLTGEVVWAARCEMARTVEDVLSRRTRALLLNARASQEVAPRVAALLADELGFDEQWQQQQVAAYNALADGYRLT